MKTYQFVLSGLGGQGILFMTKILAQTALNRGYNILGRKPTAWPREAGPWYRISRSGMPVPA